MECYACEINTGMPFTCKFCKHKFCGSHRLPEDHDCPGLQAFKKRKREDLEKGKPVNMTYSRKKENKKQNLFKPIIEKIESNPNFYIGIFLLSFLVIMTLIF